MGLTLHPGGHGHSHGGNHGNSDSDDVEKLRLTATTTVQEDVRSRYGPVNSISGDTYGIEIKEHSHKANINVKAAFIHVVGDLLQSIGVLVAAFIIYFKPEWKLAGPICTFVFSVIVLATTLTIMRDILVVLMEDTPRSVSFKAILSGLKSIREVKDIHDLRIWSLSMDKVALSVHIAVARGTNTFEILTKASAMLTTRFGISDSTIQVEEYVPDMLDCTHCRDLPVGSRQPYFDVCDCLGIFLQRFSYCLIFSS